MNSEKLRIPRFQVVHYVGKNDPKQLSFDIVTVKNVYNPEDKRIHRKDQVIIPKGSTFPVCLSKFVYGKKHPESPSFGIQILARRNKKEKEYEYYPLVYTSCHVGKCESDTISLECFLTETCLTVQVCVDGKIYECHTNAFTTIKKKETEFYHLSPFYSPEYEKKIQYMFKKVTPLEPKRANVKFYSQTQWLPSCGTFQKIK